jgi:hypothetical protein
MENDIQSDTDIIENIKLDDIDDRHCHIPDKFKKQRPKPFLNREDPPSPQNEPF